MRVTQTLLMATIGVFALAACTPDPNAYPNDPNARTKAGAISGAILGGIIGGQGKGDNTAQTIGGAIIGGVVGGAIGNSLDKQAAELRSSVSNPNISITNNGNELVVSMPEGILFAIDSATLNSTLQNDLRAVAANLQRYPNSTIQVLGHTDNTGTAAYNFDLSQRRAQAVANVLVGSGVSSGRIQAIGRGEANPIASNLSEAGRAQNRRVEIHIFPN